MKKRRSKMLVSYQQTDLDTEIVYISITYRYRCKKCKHVFQDFETYIKHHVKTKHLGVILQCITHDALIEIP